MNALPQPAKQARYALLDTLRGLAVLSMVIYHGSWNLVSLFGVSQPFMQGIVRTLWRQSICCTFILLAGFCFSLSRRHLKNSLILYAMSAVVTLVTCLFFPDNSIWFGILFLLGSCALLLAVLQKPLSHCSPILGLLISFVVFVLLYQVPDGSISFFGVPIAAVPQVLYHSVVLTPLGFPTADFYSADYYPLIPWFFLYLCGYFLSIYCKQCKKLPAFSSFRIRPLAFLGRHSLLIYMLHQPVLFLVQSLYFAL